VIVVVIGRLLVLSPAPWYVLPTAYIGLTVLALVLAWWGIALWRAGGRAGNIVWMIFARVGALISAFWATFGCMAAAGVVQEYVARGAQRTVMGHPTHTSLAVVIILIIDQLAPIILGVTGILLSYRVLGPRPGTNPKYDAIHGRWAKPFKWLSLASIVFCALQILATILVRA
jgi:hypothetical protein